MAGKNKSSENYEKIAKGNANYDFKQHAPKLRMGSGSFANLPREAIFRSFSGKVDYRGGIPNNPVMDVNFISEVDENMREHHGDDSA